MHNVMHALCTRDNMRRRSAAIKAIYNIYRMADNFRGVLIFVVDLAVTKFSHPRKLMPTVIWCTYYASPR